MIALKLALLGDPVEHSLSPRLHRLALDRLGIAGAYEAFRAPPAELSEKVRALRREDYRGFNLTRPHKESILPLLDAVEPLARALGAVNTVTLENGRLLGANTDAEGLWRALALAEDSLASSRALLVGAGGAARGVLGALALAGVARLHWLNRDLERVRRLADAPPKLDRLPAILPGPLDAATLRAAFDDGVRLVINATPLGLSDWDPSPLPAALWPERGGLAVDLAYGRAPSAFLREAAAAGWRTLDGLPMLVQQGLLSLERWTGQPDLSALAAPLLLELRSALR